MATERETFFEGMDPSPEPAVSREYKRGRILAEKALKTINGDRQDKYGSPEDSFELISKYWSTYLDVRLDGSDVALMMGLFKIAREQKAKGTHEDNVVDLVGYSLLYGDIMGYGK